MLQVSEEDYMTPDRRVMNYSVFGHPTRKSSGISQLNSEMKFNFGITVAYPITVHQQ